METSEILLVVTGTDRFAGSTLKTGLWLSEITHIYHSAKEQGYEITVASPEGGPVPIDPESLKPVFLDKVSKECRADPAFRKVLQHAQRLDKVADRHYACVYLAGGHGAMYDFPDNTVLQLIIKEQYESNRMVAAICHGVCGLLNVKLSDDGYLIKNKKITGFSWFEESLARRKKVVPFDLEAALKARGADYRKAWIPMMAKVVVDGNLVTGQDPFSSKKMAKVVMQQLKEK